MNPPVESLADRPQVVAAQAPSTAPATGPETGRPSAEVALITRNSEADLARSLPLIREAAARASADLLFVDLGSVDGTRGFAERHAPGARGVWLEADDGLKGALAAAALCSDAEVLVVLQPTAQPSDPGAIAAMIEHLEEHPYAAMAVPNLRAQTGHILETAERDPAPEPFASVEWADSEVIAVRRSALRDVMRFGWTDGPDFAQLELCIKLRSLGREIHRLRAVEWRDVGGQAARRLSDRRRLSPRTMRVLATHPGYALRLLGRRPLAAGIARLLRRGFDIAVSALLLTLLAPILLVLTVAIRIDSAGPVIFRQRRLGHAAQPFEMFKFRTMRHDSDPALHEQFVRDMILNRIQARDGGRVQVFKVHPDPRITRLGRLLRRTSLDELPQLLNVLRGDMTLVGFRPPIPYELNDYPRWFYRRFDGRPGITGLWQVSGRNERSYEEMVSLDIEYENRRTWLTDLLLLARTVGVVISGRGAY